MLAWAVGSVGLLLAGAFAVAQTATGKRLIAELLGRALSSADTTVRLTGLDGLIPFDFRLAQLRMADPQGAWLELDDLRVSASPAALLRGRLDIEQLSARRLALHRLPQGEEAAAKPCPNCRARSRRWSCAPSASTSSRSARRCSARMRCSDCPAACGPARPAAP